MSTPISVTINYDVGWSYRLFQRRSLATLTMLSLLAAGYSIWVAISWSDALTKGALYILLVHNLLLVVWLVTVICILAIGWTVSWRRYQASNQIPAIWLPRVKKIAWGISHAVPVFLAFHLYLTTRYSAVNMREFIVYRGAVLGTVFAGVLGLALICYFSLARSSDVDSE